MASFSFSSSTPRAGQRGFLVRIVWDQVVTGVTQSDITVKGGTISALVSLSNTTFLWVNVDSGELGLKITVAKDAATQGNKEGSVQWGTFGIAVTLTASKTLSEPGTKVTLTADFESDVTGVTAADFSATDADGTAVTLENFQADSTDASRYTIDAVMPSSGSGTVTVKLAENAATEGNTEETVDITYSPVSVVFTDDDADDIIDYSGTVKLTATFNRAVTGINAADFTATVGTLSGFKKVSDLIYEITWTAPASGSGTATITLAEDAATQGNPEATLSLTYPTPATVTLTAVPTLVNIARDATVTATFNKDVTGIALDDFTADVGTLSGLKKVSAKVYRITWTAPASGSGTAKITLAEDAATQGNPETTADIAYSPVSVVLTDDDADDIIDYDGTVKLTATFDRAVTGINAADFTATVGALSGLKKVSDLIYEITWTAPASGSGTATITLAEDAATQGNPEATLSFTYPTPPATVSLTRSAASVFTGRTTRVTATFNKDVTGIALNDFSSDVGTVSRFTKVSDKVYRITWTAPASGNGTATITLRANAATERNAVATVNIAYAPEPPATVSLTSLAASVNTGQTTTVTATFNKDVTGIALNDFSSDVGTVSRFTKVSDKVYRVTWTAPASGTGTATITLRANAATVGNAEATADIAYAPIPPARVILAAGASFISLGKTTTVTATFNKDVTGIALNDFSSDVGTVSAFTKVSDKVYRVTWTAPASGTGTATITLRANAATVGNAEATADIAYAPAKGFSLHNALFFKKCVNYLNNGGRVSVHGNPKQLVHAAADNDFQTYTTKKDLDINIAVNGNPTRVDAIFVKGQNITAHSATPTGGSGSGYSNRKMPATVKNWEGTDVSTLANGFQHDLYLLDAHFTATRVRLRFTGSNVKIVEVMLLEFGISIDANGDFTEINADFVDRSGEIHSAPGGSLGYGSPVGAERDKWEVDYAVKVVPGKTLLETPEEFLYWRSENRNHVHAQEPSRFPWRIFPATFVGERVPVRYRTDDKTGGEILSFRVAEQ